MAAAPPGVSVPSDSERLEALLTDLAGQVRLGGSPLEAGGHCPTGLTEVDRLLGGGFPCDGLSEITGAASSGRTSLALALLGETTRASSCAAVVDLADAFDPPSAEAAGVALERILWVRCSQWREALRACERLLATEGFPLVLLDTHPPGQGSTSHDRPVGPQAWTRLSRLAASTRTALVVLSDQRLTGFHAELAIAMSTVHAHFRGTPSLLEQLDTRIELVRHRSAPIHRSATLQLVSPFLLDASDSSNPSDAPPVESVESDENVESGQSDKSSGQSEAA